MSPGSREPPSLSKALEYTRLKASSLAIKFIHCFLWSGQFSFPSSCWVPAKFLNCLELEHRSEHYCYHKYGHLVVTWHCQLPLPRSVFSLPKPDFSGFPVKRNLRTLFNCMLKRDTSGEGFIVVVLFVWGRSVWLVVFDSILPNPICIRIFLRQHPISKRVVDGRNLEPTVFLER